MNNSFIFFGCWNNINCDKEAIYRDVVLNCIKEFEPNISNMFIAGDNWYNTLLKNKENKEESYKYYLVDTLVSGYHILYTMNKNIYICVGNHDEASSNQKNPDCMINTQKHYINKLKNYIEGKTKSLENVKNSSQEAATSLKGSESDYTNMMIIDLLGESLPSIEQLETKEYPDNVIKLYADTNIGVYEDASSSYIVIIINTNILSPNYLKSVKKKIEAIKKKSGNQNKLIFVMGHIPLFYDKHKKDKASKEKDKDTAGKEGKEGKEGTVTMGALETPKKEKESKEKDTEKGKKGEDITKLKKGTFVFDDSGNSLELIDSLYDILADNNCIYLCADCHNFNIMKIQKGDKCVIQITSGTGGADPDIIKDLSDKIDITISEYNITYYSINSYGYSKIVVEGDSIVVSYNKLIAADSNNKSIDELYVYSVKNNDIEYSLSDKEKIKKGIISNATNNKDYYCGRVARYSTSKDEQGRETNVIKSVEQSKGVCYKKKGK